MMPIRDYYVCKAIEARLQAIKKNWIWLGSETGFRRLCMQAAQGLFPDLPTDFLQTCVEMFGLQAASRAKFEDTMDLLLDRELRELLTSGFPIRPTGCSDCFFRKTCDHMVPGEEYGRR